jgi:hypothetical protein
LPEVSRQAEENRLENDGLFPSGAKLPAKLAPGQAAPSQARSLILDLGVKNN